MSQDARRDPGLGEASRQRLQLARVEPRGETGVTPWAADARDDVDGPAFEIDFLQYWHVLWKHRLLILGAVLVSAAIAVAITVLTTPIYTANATIQIDRETAKVVNMQDVQPREDVEQSDEFYQTQYGLLRSRSLAERVIETMSLEDQPNFLKFSGLKRDASTKTDPLKAKVFHEAVLKRVMSSLGVEPVHGSRLVKLSYDNPNPVFAASIANSFVDSFIAMNLERRYESSSYARDFLEKQIAIAKTKLEDSERAAVQYEIDQQIINLHDDNGQGGGNSAAQESLVEKNLSALDSAYAIAQADRIDAEAKWRQASAAQGLGLTQDLQDPTIQELSQEKAKLEAQYQDQMRLFRPSYPPALQLKAQIDSLNEKIQAEAGNVKQSVRATYEAALSREQQLAAQVNTLKSNELNLKDRSIKYNFLQREVDTNRTLYDGLLQRYKEVGVTGGVAANNVSVIDRADPPLTPSKPRPVLNLAVALVIGFGLGVLGAFTAEALDQAVRSPGDVEVKLGVPLLGAVPLLTKGVTPQEAMQDPRSSFWEAYFSIRTALQFSSTSGVPRSIVAVSSRPGEGKTTTSIALAYSLARLGAKVLLVDADLRKPSLHTRLGLDHGMGLSNFLTGAATFSELPQASEIPSLSVITSGPLPPTPAELLADMRFRAFIAEAEKHFDIVVIDGPPVMGFADAPMIAAAVDGTLVVVESGRTGRAQIRSSLRRLQMGNAKILGVVLQKYDIQKASYGYGYGYGYYAYEYGETKKDERKKQLAS